MTILCFNLNPAQDKTLEIPGFHIGGHERARTVAFIPSGKGMNVARGLRCLGTDSTGLGFIGKGEYDWFSDELRKYGAVADLTAVDGRTRINTSIVDPVNHTTTHVREEGFLVSERDKRELSAAVERSFSESRPKMAVFSGSLPPGFEVSDFLELIRKCRNQGTDIYVDNSGEALKAAVDAGVDLIKPNEEELSELAGRELAPRQFLDAARRIQKHVATVLVSLGEWGGIVVTRDGEWGAKVEISKSEIVNTVGCGDAFMCGWVIAALEGHEPEEAVRWAAACGTACVTLPTSAGYSMEMLLDMLARCRSYDPAKELK